MALMDQRNIQSADYAENGVILMGDLQVYQGLCFFQVATTVLETDAHVIAELDNRDGLVFFFSERSLPRSQRSCSCGVIFWCRAAA